MTLFLFSYGGVHWWGNRWAYRSMMGLATRGGIDYTTPVQLWSSLPSNGEHPSMSSVEERVKKIVAEQLGVKLEEVTNQSSFVEDLGADSLDTVELVMALEEEFETEIPDEDAEKITKVQEAIDYVLAHQS